MLFSGVTNWYAAPSADPELPSRCARPEALSSVRAELVEAAEPARSDSPARATTGPGTYGANSAFTHTGPAPGPPPPCGVENASCRFGWTTSTRLSPSRPRPRQEFSSAPSPYTRAPGP